MLPIEVIPNPPKAGGDVTIRGPKNGKVFIIVPGEDEPREEQLDDNGEVTIPVPVAGGKRFTVMNLDPDDQEVIVTVSPSGE